tara:strand:+ start:715 stop:1434 length:720 start_codon:yes stop_codon:yes gene_type:complete
LESILQNDFIPRFSLEHILESSEHPLDDIEMAFPMVCFCDIPLSQTTQHMNTYGNYAIGLSKEWGLKNRVTPVQYYYRESPNFDAFLKLLSFINENIEEDNTHKKEMTMQILRVGLYKKIYEGSFFRGSDYLKDVVKFYDEREWRYVPELSDLVKLKLYPSLEKKDFLNKKLREDRNKSMEALKLKFEPKDIKYIVVKEDNEIIPIVESLKKSKRKYSYEDVQIITTRIITSSQIKEDF